VNIRIVLTPSQTSLRQKSIKPSKVNSIAPHVLYLEANFAKSTACAPSAFYTLLLHVAALQCSRLQHVFSMTGGSGFQYRLPNVSRCPYGSARPPAGPVNWYTLRDSRWLAVSLALRYDSLLGQYDTQLDLCSAQVDWPSRVAGHWSSILAETAITSTEHCLGMRQRSYP